MAILLLLAFPLFALITYQMGLYELSFINRGELSESSSSATPQITVGSLLSLPIAETEEATDSQSAQGESVAPAEDDFRTETSQSITTPEAFTRSLYAYSTATSYGFKVDPSTYTKSGQIITLVDGAVDFGDRYSLRPAVSVQVPYRSELAHGGYSIEYKTESTEIPLLQTYGGYLIVDRGSTYSLSDPTGVILVDDLKGFEPAYLRDAQNRLLFTDGTRYACLDSASGELKILEDFDAEQIVAGIEYDHDEGYGRTTFGLTPFFSPLVAEDEGSKTVTAAYLQSGQYAITRAAVRGEITASFRPVSETYETDKSDESDEAVEALPEDTTPEPEDTTLIPIAPSDIPDTSPELTAELTAEPTETTIEPLDTTLESIAESTNVESAPVTEPVESTAEVLPDTLPIIETEPATEVVTEPATEAETEPITELVTEATASVTEAVTEPRETTEAEAKEAERAARREERITENGGLWGYKDAAGNVVIEPSYLKAFNFNENGLAAVVTTDGTQVFINRYGQVVLDAYGTIYYHRELYAYDGWYPPEIYTEDNLGMFYFDSGLVRVRRKVVHYTYNHYILEDADTLIDSSGKTFNIPSGYTLEAYSEGVLLLSRDGKYGYMDVTGSWLTGLIYTYARPFHEGLAVCGFEEMYVGMIDREGNFAVPMVYDYLSDLSMGIFTAYSPALGWQVFAKLS